MLSTTNTFTLDGISARPVRVEVDIHRGRPGFAIVGLLDVAVREARERVRAALGNCGFEFPLQRVVVNLAPASLRKAGPGIDLAIAVALLSASGQLHWKGLSEIALVGELALDGSTRPVNGAISIAEAARDSGAKTIVVPVDNGAEAALVSGIEVVGLDSLGRIGGLISGEWTPKRPTALHLQPPSSPSGPDLAELRGADHLRRALEVAAAGGHSLLMVGPPGAGKSLAAARLPSILPPMEAAEAMEVARISSACGCLDTFRAQRPFRAPHHTISPANLIGGGTPPRPGEVTLAHRGVLFLDELSEFRRDALEALTSALDSGEVSISRGSARRMMPARFIVIASANPCPCGRGVMDPDCTCTAAAVQRHLNNLNAALADQVEILVPVREPRAEDIGGPLGETSAAVRKRVVAARRRQEARLGHGRCNAEMTPAEVRRCALGGAAAIHLAEFYSHQQTHGGVHERALRLAQTIADLAGADSIGEAEITEALRLTRRQYP
jgi:magnesium chelatase family protein